MGDAEPAAGAPVPPVDADAAEPVRPPALPGPDEERMLRAREGDAAAFGELYDRWSGPILRYFFHLSYDRAGAEDLMQETFLRVWRAAPRYEVRARFSTYLFQVAKNLWINERAKVLRRPLRVSLDAPLGGEEDGPTRGDRIDSGAAPPEREAERAETGRRIRAAVEGLSERLREVFVLAAFQEMAYREVAEILGIPEGTVKSRMWTAVRRLREALEAGP